MKIKKNFLGKIALLFCTALACFAIGIVNVSTVAKANETPLFSIVDGASVRIQEPYGMRFSADYSKTLFNQDGALKEGYEAGILLIQTEELNGELVIGTAGAKNVTAMVWDTENGAKDHYRLNAVISNIPETEFDTYVTARAYLKQGTEVSYSGTISRNVAQVASRAMADGYTGTVIENYINKVNPQITLPQEVDAEGNVTLNLGQSITYAVAPEYLMATVTTTVADIVEIDNNTITAIKSGETQVTIKVGSLIKTVNVNVTINVVRPTLTSLSITNRTALQAEWNIGDDERTVEIAFNDSQYWNENNTEYTITSSDSQIVKAEGKTLTAVGKGTATITLTAQGKTDTVSITVSIGAPTLEIAGDIESVNVPAGTSALPEITAKNYEGNDISGRVTITCDNGNVTVNQDKTLSVSEKGTYTLTITVSDVRDTTKSAQKQLTVNVMRNVFNAVNGDGTEFGVTYAQGSEYTADDKQTAYIDNVGITFGQFDMQPSKVYYAAVTFTANSAEDWNAMYGMSHSVKGSAPTSWLSFFVDRGPSANARNAKIKYFDMSLTETWKELHPDRSVTPIYVSNQLYNLRGLDNADPFPVKFETVRNGDFFYFFINGKYVMGCTDKNLKDKDTLPGIFQFSGIKTGMTAIEWVSGDDAVTKFNYLTDNGNKLIGKYKHADWVSTSDGNFSVNGKDAGNIGFTFNNKDADWNDGLLSQYMYFDGDFTYEWTYKFTDCNGWSRMTLNIANFNSTSPFIQYGAVCSTSNTGDSHLLIETAKGDSAKYETGWSWNNTSGWGGFWGANWQNPPEKIRFKVARICTTDSDGNPIARYVFTMTALNIYNGNGYNQGDVGNTVGWTFDWDGKNGDGASVGNPCGAVIMNFCNYHHAGECSNIDYKSSSVPATTEQGPNLFYNDFTVEYDFAFAEDATGDDSWGKNSSLTIKDLSGKDLIQFKISPMANGNCCVGVSALKESEDGYEDMGGAWSSTITDKYKIKVIRTCNADGSVSYTVQVWKNGSESIHDKTVTRNAFYGLNSKATDPVIVSIANSGIDGTFTNVSWSATTDNA